MMEKVIGKTDGLHFKISGNLVSMYHGEHLVKIYVPFGSTHLKVAKLINRYGDKWAIRFVSNLTSDVKYILVSTRSHALEVAKTRTINGNEMINYHVGGVFAPISEG